MACNLPVKKADILHVLQRIQGLTGRTTNLAITKNVLIRGSENSITLTATDLETGFEGTYPAEVAEEGLIAIHSRKLFEIVRDFPSDDVLLTELDNRWVQIGAENVQYNIVCANPDDFPETPFIEDIPFFEIESGALKEDDRKEPSDRGRPQRYPSAHEQQLSGEDFRGGGQQGSPGVHRRQPAGLHRMRFSTRTRKCPRSPACSFPRKS